MKQKFTELYMDWAKRCAELSHAKRLHVRAVIVKDDTVISYGYNGMPAGWDNDCEYKNYDISRDFNGNYFPDPENLYPFEETVVVANDNESFETTMRYGLKTKPEVLHAESNAIAKLAKSNNSGLGADLFVTHMPCLECAKLIYQSGISRVWYGENYRDDAGVKFLRTSGVQVKELDQVNELE